MPDTMSLRVDMDKALKSFQRMSKRAANPKSIMDVLAAKTWKEVIDHFKKEEGEDGSWPKWSRTNKKTGRKTVFNTRPTKRGGSKLLQDTGTLRNSLQHKGLKKQAIVFTNVKYAKYHQSRKPRTKLPRRDFMWISDLKRKQLTETFLSYIIRGL